MMQRSAILAHNQKVVGSNPTPATSFLGFYILFTVKRVKLQTNGCIYQFSTIRCKLFGGQEIPVEYRYRKISLIRFISISVITPDCHFGKRGSTPLWTAKGLLFPIYIRPYLLVISVCIKVHAKGNKRLENRFLPPLLD